MADQIHPQPEAETRIEQPPEERDERTHRASGKPLRASPFSWETAARIRPPWRR